MKRNANREKVKNSHMPDDSLFYDRLVPAALIALGILMVLILIAVLLIVLGIIF